MMKSLVTLCLCITAGAAGAWADEYPLQYRKLRVIDSLRGDSDGQVRESLRGLTIAPDGKLYVVGDSKLLVLSPEGKLVRSWKTERPGYGVGVASSGTVYVGEQQQVEVFDAEGKLQATWRDPEHMRLVTAIAFVGDNVLCADALGRCIRKFDANGKYLADIGKDERRRGFMLPNGYLDFALDTANVIHVADAGRHRVERFTLDGEELGYFGRYDALDPVGFTGCCNPTNLAMTPAGQIVAVVKAPPAVKVYNRIGGLQALFGESDFDPNCKNSDVAVDAHGHIYVIDTARLQIVVYEPVTPPATQPAETQP